MNEKELLNKYELDKPCLEAWGEYLINCIQQKIVGKGFEPKDLLKIFPISPRIKEDKSFIEKALYRNKNYEDPYNNITDKVGVRFVVLTVKDINIIKQIIKDFSDWNISEDRDFITERDKKPEMFTYQSVHYVVRNNNEIQYNNLTIKANTPCEIQVRTLLQHAYAELSHDIIYKTTEQISPDMRRKFARSMAFIEATDELFMEVQEMVNDEYTLFNDFIKIIKPFTISSFYVDKLNKLVFQAYKPFLEKQNINFSDILKFIDEKAFLKDKVQSETFVLMRNQPVSYLLYYIISKFRHQAIEYFPLDEKELQPLYNDLGQSIEY